MRTIKMITVSTAAGEILDFGDFADAITEEVEIAVGDKATIDGKNANGEFVLTDGKTLVFVNGVITEIKEPSPVLALMTAMKKMSAEFKSWRALMMPNKDIKHNNHRKLWKEGGKND